MATWPCPQQLVWSSLASQPPWLPIGLAQTGPEAIFLRLGADPAADGEKALTSYPEAAVIGGGRGQGCHLKDDLHVAHQVMR